MNTRAFRNRNKASQEAVKQKLKRIDRRRLARECAKLDPDEEKRFAEEGLSSEVARKD